MKALYETPAVELINFAAMETIADNLPGGTPVEGSENTDDWG